MMSGKKPDLLNFPIAFSVISFASFVPLCGLTLFCRKNAQKTQSRASFLPADIKLVNEVS
jgi:hypothetical protein